MPRVHTCMIVMFDNSPGNRYNPDPTEEVRWGDQSWEETFNVPPESPSLR